MSPAAGKYAPPEARVGHEVAPTSRVVRLVPWLAAVTAIVLVVGAVSAFEVLWLWRDAPWKPALYVLTVARHLIEVLCIAYAVAFMYAAVRYVALWRKTSKGRRVEASGTRHVSRSTSGAANSNGRFTSPEERTGSNRAARAVRHLAPTPPTQAPPLAIIYLCCNDLEEEAVRSLSTLRYDGALLHIVHDDSTDPAENERVDAFAEALERELGVRWCVMRRPHKGGGKPAALQWILEETAHEHELFLLLDNDSYVCDPDILHKALPCFDDPQIAAVQFRNRPKINPEDGAFAQTVAGAIDIFDAFATGLFVKLWKPFVGHNAVLRTSAVMEAGGFTPGMFADDLDLTVRMTLRGNRVEYRRDLAMEECHPSNYRSFTLRSKKWAHGCAQIIRTHLLSVLATDRMSCREKLGFLMFTGFYITQVLMLLYMLLVFIVLPIMIGPTWKAAWWALLLGTIVPASIFLPVIAYLLTAGRGPRRLPFFRTLGAATVTYGSTDLWTILGLSSGFRKGERKWVPTNSVSAHSSELRTRNLVLDWGHFAAGSTVLLVPLYHQPGLLLFPLTWLFAAKFLFVPAVAVHYGAPKVESTPMFQMPKFQVATSRATWMLVALSVIAVFAFSAAAVGQSSSEHRTRSSESTSDPTNQSEPPPHIRVEIRGSDILIDGRPTIIRGMHYGPWRPGTGPGRGFPYPSNEEVLPDLRMIRSLNANTILIYDPPARVLDLAHQNHLNVIYVFNIQWWQLAESKEKRAEIIEEITENVKLLHEKPAVIAWMLGNEIEGWVIDALEPAGVRGFLSDLRASIREIDPWRPVTHGNWPLLRTLDLDQEMDIVSYNVYPFYPTEVAVSGYGAFIREHLMPLSGGRPLIISEFGLNTLEATPQQQAEVLQRCWYELLDAGTNGGVVFAFADEWWKNYDNPIRPPDYWRRIEAPDDHVTHDPDPEENYGIVTAHRVPKPAFEAVREMFSLDARPNAPAAAIVITPRQILLGIGTAAVFGVIGIAIWLRVRAPTMPA